MLFSCSVLSDGWSISTSHKYHLFGLHILGVLKQQKLNF